MLPLQKVEKADLEAIKQRVIELETELRALCKDGPSPQLVLVTKTVPVDKIMVAYEVGIRDFGENRAQELLEKKPQLPHDIRWHFIGHLQTNKVKQVLHAASLIQSLDRPELADEIAKQADHLKLPKVDCLLQLNTSGETSKFGFEPSAAEKWVQTLKTDSPIRLLGLMTIGPNTKDKKLIRQAFALLRKKQEKFKRLYPYHPWEILSMGMTSDYHEALAEGSNMLRIGSLVFGPRG